MKKKDLFSHYIITVLFLMLFVTLKTYAIDYTITFTGTGASTTVDSVIVQNLTKGTTVTVPAGNVLNLNDAPNVVEQVNAEDETIRVYPNPVEGKSTVSFFAKQAGSTQLNAFSIDGRKVVGINQNLQTGINLFQLSLPKGVFVIQVVGNGYTYTAKMINQTGKQSKPEITYSGTVKPATSNPQKSKSSTPGTTTMTYATGDQLLYKGTSGNYSTIVTDIPTASKTTNFDFVACADADGNNYTTVTIGTQTWMAENLKTTKYNDGTSIPNVSDNTAWSNLITPAYCWYNNDATTYKNTYGALYNWYTVNTGKLCPKGWHVPSDMEWTILTNFLGGESVAGGQLKEMDTNYWFSPNAGGTNSSGFTALPGGYRVLEGGFFGVGYYGTWHCSTMVDAGVWDRLLDYRYVNVFRGQGNLQGGNSVRCVRDLSPGIITSSASMVSTNSATSGGNVTNDGGGTITSRGVCWSTSPSPTIALSTKTTETGTTGSFTSLITGLSPNTTYYLRAYATSDAGTGYGNQDSIKTFAVMDIDGNGYHSVTIGTQTWLVENLKTTKYNDGTAIPVVTENTAWAALSTPAYCWYNNDATTYKNKYGALYNWYAVNTAKLAPTGWHVATDAEWTILENYVTANSGTSGTVAKALASTIDWAASTNAGAIGNDLTKNNSSGFSALPGGFRGNDGAFSYVGYYGVWWSSSEDGATTAWGRGMSCSLSAVLRGDSGSDETHGYSVRCVKDTIPTVSDIDGNIYHTVQIGTQTWMVENLKTTRYRTGEAIGTTTPATKDIGSESAPKYQWAYNGDENLAAKYGRLYTWYAVADSRNIAPVGWHVPTDAEWTTLENYLVANGYNYDGTTTDNKIAKSLAATTDWLICTYTGAIGNDLTKNNTSGFTALPGGDRYYDGTFNIVGNFGYWWSSTESYTTYAWYRSLFYSSLGLYRYYLYSKSYGFSVRCVRDY